ncbi:mannose-P-dolichol utilization defect 1 protein [Conidiobolus coronatus NRRL 28638]|uniref:Mannose-P-dolichol utilization defect 1 protein homolog n=1 Tax=Conidiobolus coronatus (strain ATCC 28846 / CBS 209.66 / NRRL 28638) TaxID=796925 RepID=A0A137P2Z3_CONC2|nr:mannose-P-dolichol utilization defect 1 protein [Conidiobolus coronatus NRRL 28638]|eukprot:KXN69274.1 mannose-P-dolichol utilization defect 1 protein [Conidiobolus coronatus NRRL 28638]
MSNTPIINLPNFLRTPAVGLIGEKCYTELIENLNFTNVPCLKYAISKGLGLGIVVGGSIVKIPQILKIVNSGSVEGISLFSYSLETLSYLVSISYNLRNNNPFSTWGETLLITFQNFIILSLIQVFNNNLLGTIWVVLGGSGIHYLLNGSGLVSLDLLTILQGATIPVTLFSRVPQILTNYRNGHTGQLSAFTVFNYFFGTLARVFTTLQEVDDKVILISFLLALTMNSILAAQMIYYWNVKPAKAQASPKASSEKKDKKSKKLQ